MGCPEIPFPEVGDGGERGVGERLRVEGRAADEQGESEEDVRA